MRFRQHILFLFLVFCFSGSLYSQVADEELVQFSGVVVTADSINPVSFTNIIIKNSWRGTVADYYGYFSFVAHINDTISFSAMGFKKSEFIIPDTITEDRYSLIQVMSTDTILLTQTIIYPWPSREEFVEHFLKFDVPDDDYERARKNLEGSKIRELAAQYPMDASMNHKNTMRHFQERLYYIGQTQPITVLNAFAWAEFIKAWKEGKFKRTKNDLNSN